jgi:hypothetical protein
MTFIVDHDNDTLTVGPCRGRSNLNCVVLERTTVACFFDISLEETALALGVGCTMIKRIRRWHGIARWPQTTLVTNGFVDVDLKNIERVRAIFFW